MYVHVHTSREPHPLNKRCYSETLSTGQVVYSWTIELQDAMNGTDIVCVYDLCI